MNDKKIKIIADNNKVIILKFIDLLCKWFNLTEEKIKNIPKEHLKFHIRNALTRVKVDEYKLQQLRLEIEEKGRILEEFKRAYVGGDSFDAFEEGKNTGGKGKAPDIRHIKMLQMKKEQADRIIEYDEIEKKIKEKHSIIREFIELMPQTHFVKIMDMTYFKGNTRSQIARQVSYEPDYIEQVRHRAVNELCHLVKNYF